MDIYIQIQNRIATLVEPVTIICGNNDYVINFSFDREWEKYPVKTLRIAKKNSTSQTVEEILFVGNSVLLPTLYNVDEISVEVFAGDLRTSTKVKINCLNNNSFVHDYPNKDIYEQLLEYLKGKKAGMDYVVNGDLLMSRAATGSVNNAALYIPPDCPFDIRDTNYYIGSIKSWGYYSGGGGVYNFTKTTDEYAVGMIVYINAGYTTTLLMSPIQTAVQYTYNSGSIEFEYDGKTWYKSTAQYATGADARGSAWGLPIWPDTVGWENDTFINDDIIAILHSIGVANK